MQLRWFISSTVRHAADMRKHVQKLLNSQRDILSPQAVSALEEALKEIKAALDADADDAALQKQMEALEKTATKWIKPYPYADWRDNVEVFLVAIVVAMGIRTFFCNPSRFPPARCSRRFTVSRRRICARIQISKCRVFSLGPTNCWRMARFTISSSLRKMGNWCESAG